MTDIAPVPVDELRSPGNIRHDVGDINELKESIGQVGILSPITVRSHNGHYEVLDGHRRLAAAKALGLTRLPVYVRPTHQVGGDSSPDPEVERLAVQLVANLQRADLQPLEEAQGFAQLRAYGWTQRQISQRVGCSESVVSKRLSLLELPDRALDLHEKGRIGPESLYQLTKAQKAGVDLTGMLTQLEETDPDDTPDVAGEVEAMVRVATARATAETELSSRKLELNEIGVAIHEPEYDQWGSPKLPADQLGYSFDLDHDKHLKEPCALVAVWVQHGRVRESQHCTDRRRHSPDGASDLKLPKKPISADAKAKKEARARSQALEAAALAVLEARPPARDKITERMAVLYLDAVYADVHKKAAKWLGYSKELEGEYKGLIDLYEKATTADQYRILLAVVLAHGHARSAGTWSEVDEAHVAFLTEAGSPPELTGQLEVDE